MEKKEHKELLILYKSTKKDLSKYKFLPWKFNIAHAILTAFLFANFVYKPGALMIDCDPFFIRYVMSFGYFLFSFVVIAVTFYSCYRFCLSKDLLNKIISNFSSETKDLIDGCYHDKVKFCDKIPFMVSLAFPFLSLLLIVLVVWGKFWMWSFSIWLPIVIAILANICCCSKKSKHSKH